MRLAEPTSVPEDTRLLRPGRRMPHGLPLPLMPRMYIALARENRFPAPTSCVPDAADPHNCQWRSSLRNHDEVAARDGDAIAGGRFLWQTTPPTPRASPASISGSPSTRTPSRARPPAHRADDCPALYAQHAVIYDGDEIDRTPPPPPPPHPPPHPHGRQHPLGDRDACAPPCS